MTIAEKILILGSDDFTNSKIEKTLRLNEDWIHSIVNFIPTPVEALSELSVSEYRAVIVDCPSLDSSALEVLIQLNPFCKETPIIILNQASNEKTAVSCLKYGAAYYLVKDMDWEDQLPHVLEIVVEEHLHKMMLKRKMLHLAEENQALKASHPLDTTTLFYSADHFKTMLSRELKRASRYAFNLTCLVMDVKNKLKKKSVESGNNGFESLAHLLKGVVRSCDIWGRLDQNRFAALLPHTSLKQAKDAIKRIDLEIDRLTEAAANLPFQISWGLAHFDPDKIKSGGELLNKAVASIK